jgi:hypothetical protein
MTITQRAGFTEDFDELKAKEDALLCERRSARGLDPGGPRSGLALSGGGIRAAAFGLGVSRALHARGQFKQLDYLSTVSGGGFSGGFLSWMLRRESDSRETQDDWLSESALRYIRQHANYLDPGSNEVGAKPQRTTPTQTTLFAVTLARMSLSLGVYASLLIGLFYLLHVGDAFIALLKPVLHLITRAETWTTFVDHLNFGLTAGLLVVIGGVLRQIGSIFAHVLNQAWRATIPPASQPTLRSAWRGSLWFLLGFLTAGLGLLALATIPSEMPGPVSATIATLLLGAVSVRSFRNCRTQWSTTAGPKELSWGWLILPGLAALLVAAALTAGFLMFLFQSGAGPTGVPAELSSWQGLVVLVVAACWVIWLVPHAFRSALKIARGLWQPSDPAIEYLRGLRFQRRSGTTALWAVGWFVLASVPWSIQWLPVALRSHVMHLWLLATATLVAVVWMTTRLIMSAHTEGDRPPGGPSSPWMMRVLCAGFLYGLLMLTHGFTNSILDSRVPESSFWIVGAGLVIGTLAGINFAGPGRIYRDRLAEAFLPDARAVREDRWYPALEAAAFKLSGLGAAQQRGPYPLLNASLDTTGSRISKLRQRGADSFILTPLFCGSESTGWADTTSWLGGDLTLRDAIGISAAAVEPGSGFGGHGGARDPLIGSTLAVLNLQLGYWADNPNPKHCPRPARLYPNLISPGLRHGVFGVGLSERAPRVRLSDGSHFDNLGLYELLRRGLDRIVVADSSDDPDFSFWALSLVLERASADLGVDVHFEPRDLFPDGGTSAARASVMARGFAIAHIRYADARTGTLLYLKPTLIDDLDATVQSFAAMRKGFPQESLLDQSFDEDHFIAYERLGYQIAIDGIDEQQPG